jgi:acetylglutamate kinase
MGFVGKPIETDARLLELLIAAGYLPIIACIAGDEHGTIFNVNADQMAVSCAVSWRADKLIFLTDVPGVRDASGEVASVLDTAQVRTLIESGIAHGGMQAKLEAAVIALACGIQEVTIASGDQSRIDLLPLGSGIGTRICLIAETAVAP